jgi:excisionase family DNA binding protein
MLTLLDSRRDLLVASDDEAMIARAAAAKLKPIVDARRGARLRGADGEIALDARAVGLIDDMLTAVAAGRPVSIMPEHDEFTVAQAAVFLGVGRDDVARLLATGAVPNYLVGGQCRVLKADLAVWQRRDDDRMAAVLADAREVLFPQPRPFGAGPG